MSTPLILSLDIRHQLKALAELAAANPVDARTLAKLLKTPEGKARHMAQMTKQSVLIPLAYLVTFSIEHGHPCGTSRHMSMSVQREGRVPNHPAVWMIAQELGFWGDASMPSCCVWLENLLQGKAVNLVQPIEQTNN